MKILEKIRSLSETNRKLIFWVTAGMAGLAMIIWFVLTTIARMKNLIS